MHSGVAVCWPRAWQMPADLRPGGQTIWAGGGRAALQRPGETIRYRNFIRTRNELV